MKKKRKERWRSGKDEVSSKKERSYLIKVEKGKKKTFKTKRREICE